MDTGIAQEKRVYLEGEVEGLTVALERLGLEVGARVWIAKAATRGTDTTHVAIFVPGKRHDVQLHIAEVREVVRWVDTKKKRTRRQLIEATTSHTRTPEAPSRVQHEDDRGRVKAWERLKSITLDQCGGDPTHPDYLAWVKAQEAALAKFFERTAHHIQHPKGET